MSVEILKLLRKTPIFSTLDSSSLKEITGFFKERTFSSDEVLYKEGTLGDTLYIIKEGVIKITRAAKGGEKENSRALRREGDIFGESGFIDESPRPATAEAIKTTKVFQLSRSDFLTILNNHPLIAYHIVKVLSSRIKQSDLRQIDELKEKNEQLQQTVHSLQERPEKTEGRERPERSTVSEPKQESLSARMISCMPYPVICTGMDGLISFFNKAAEKEFGYRSEDAKGKPIEMLWSQTSWSRLYQDIIDKLAKENRWEGEIIARRNNGEHFLSFTTVTETIDTDEKKDGKLYLCQNVTQKRSQEKQERTQAESVLRQQIAEEIGDSVGKEVKKLSDVFDTLPSELSQIDSLESRKKMNIMKSALDNIRGLVSDLRVSSSLEVTRELVDLESFFQEELLLLKSQEQFRDIALATQFEQDIPRVNANRRQLQQMLLAILDNAASALQAVSDRARTVTIEVGRASQKRDVQIQISDNGMGISAADISKIFKERFSTKRTGLGLGLLSVARIVESHGGEIEVYSDEGTYTLFVIKLPACKEKTYPRLQEEAAMEA